MIDWSNIIWYELYVNKICEVLGKLVYYAGWSNNAATQ